MKTVKRWVIFQLFEPFRLGVSRGCWSWKCYEVDAEDAKLTKRHEGFVFRGPRGVWQCHELVSGGYLGEGETRKLAVAMANKNISDTPDLREQIDSLGDTTGFEIVSRDEAFRLLLKGE